MENLDGTKVSFPIIIEKRKITQKVMPLWGKKKSLQITNINNLPSDSSEAKSVTSERIFAISTAAVTQELATYKRSIDQLKGPFNFFFFLLILLTDLQFSCLKIFSRKISINR